MADCRNDCKAIYAGRLCLHTIWEKQKTETSKQISYLKRPMQHW